VFRHVYFYFLTLQAMFRSLFEVKISVEVPSKDRLSYYASDLDIIDIIIRDNVDMLHPMLVAKLLANARA